MVGLVDFSSSTSSCSSASGCSDSIDFCTKHATMQRATVHAKMRDAGYSQNVKGGDGKLKQQCRMAMGREAAANAKWRAESALVCGSG